MPVAEVAQIGEQAAELLAILGIAVGGVFVALWNVEKQSKQSVEQEVAAIKVIDVSVAVAACTMAYSMQACHALTIQQTAIPWSDLVRCMPHIHNTACLVDLNLLTFTVQAMH